MITDSEDRSMIAELEQIIQAEEAKPEAERDADLIDDCIREIAELKSVRSDYSDEEIDRITDNLVKATEREKKRKRFIRLVAGVAAAFVIVSGVTACTVQPALINWFMKIVRMPLGESIESEKITFTNQGTTVIYKDIDAFLQAEKLNIYYPSILPDNIRLISINHAKNKEQDFYVFICTKPNLCFTIELMYSECAIWGELVSEIECNELNCKVYKEESVYYSVCESDSMRYIIQSDDLQDIILIIGGLKKGTK